MNENLKKILTNAGLLLIIIVICALLVRYFSGSETLAEYAEKNPSANQPTTENAEVTPSDTFNGTPEGGTLTDTSDSLEKEEIIPEKRVTYKEGFYYQPLDDTIIERITGCSYPVLNEGEVIEIAYEDLSYVVVQYVGFDFETHEGEIICNNSISEDLVEIFYELYRN